ncbi:transposase [Streptomyces sp. SA15]|uniref:transposase n=1 Tax=Streptomyces sp. SA15 TaxID=934019 RepID=UPI00359C424D
MTALSGEGPAGLAWPRTPPRRRSTEGLFLPKSWDPTLPQADPAKTARRERCGIPLDVGHVEKWQLALDMIDETWSRGVEVPLAVADGGYGDTAAFRLGMEPGASAWRRWWQQNGSAGRRRRSGRPAATSRRADVKVRPRRTGRVAAR